MAVSLTLNTSRLRRNASDHTEVSTRTFTAVACAAPPYGRSSRRSLRFRTDRLSRPVYAGECTRPAQHSPYLSWSGGVPASALLQSACRQWRDWSAWLLHLTPTD